MDTMKDTKTQPATDAVIEELLDRLEAAEKDAALKERVIDALGSELNAVAKEGDTMRTKISDLTINVEYLGNLKKSYEELIGELQDDRDALQAKIAEMEQQEPAYWGPKHAIEGGSTTVIVGKFPVNPTDAPLYALPGAKGEGK